MAFIYKLVGFDRKTERLAAAYDIPSALVESAREIAGIASRPEIVGDWPLTPRQAAAIADMIDQRIDLGCQDFALEPYETESRSA
ncbi:MAG TPA: hypothetical protein VMF86_02245 [Stellaceae bacterium]|nr:hypothetical protein [Stellaceae bacterium]